MEYGEFVHKEAEKFQNEQQNNAVRRRQLAKDNELFVLKQMQEYKQNQAKREQEMKGYYESVEKANREEDDRIEKVINSAL